MSNAQILRTPTDWNNPDMQRRIQKRYASEKRFRLIGLVSVALSAIFLAFLLFNMLGQGFKGFLQTRAEVTIDMPAMTGGASVTSISGPNAEAAINGLDLQGVAQAAITQQYGNDQGKIFSSSVGNYLKLQLLDNPELIEQKTTFNLPVNSEIDIANKGDGDAESEAIVARLEKAGTISTVFNMDFLTGGDATDPSEAGIWSAFKGSLMTMVITMLLAFPVGVLSALYLEEFAPKNRLTDFIEVSINNLAAVPSIIFGLLGLVIFLSWFGMARSSALVGGLTLALMTMPVIVIAGRNAIKAVPPSIREAAMGIGASPMQVIFHHVLPLALPGILTGTIIGMARALGETAPLLMIGMRAFVSTPASGFGDPSSVLPVQIYLWSDEVNRGFVEKTSAAIIVLLIFLMAMNATAIYLRNRFENRW
ncbi:phosphate ABC transporter, permease protein PstA [Sphingorhabdus lutea]|uniref:Phosphate transport system permease protein PstA n=1 Tax=Sphingorhabdus lutea TaxID=1913578 RepID=A0A1L3JAQ9_9SPHN|nr:phosphate ABC transporter permease PstA [Sphingorhabdus lutea]APG62208.1 phosphate ABC transporter, permease protein PstA [Sphingorhabdus lutea]